MSNPFRRKKGADGGTESGRASLDADEGQRIQMVAQQAFDSPILSSFDASLKKPQDQQQQKQKEEVQTQLGENIVQTPERIPTPEKAKKKRAPAATSSANEEGLTRKTSQNGTAKPSLSPSASASQKPPPPSETPPKPSARPAPPPPRRRHSLKDSSSPHATSTPAAATTAATTATATATATSATTGTTQAPTPPPRPARRRQSREVEVVGDPVDPFQEQTDNAGLGPDVEDEQEIRGRDPLDEERTTSRRLSGQRRHDDKEEQNYDDGEDEGEDLSSSSLSTVSDEDEGPNEDHRGIPRSYSTSHSTSHTSSSLHMTPSKQKPNPFRQKENEDDGAGAGDDGARSLRHSFEADNRPKFTGNVKQTGSAQARTRQSMDVDAFKQLMLTGQVSQPAYDSTGVASETIPESPPLARTTSLHLERKKNHSLELDDFPRMGQQNLSPSLAGDDAAGGFEEDDGPRVKSKPAPPKPRSKNRLSQLQPAPPTDVTATGQEGSTTVGNTDTSAKPLPSSSSSSLDAQESLSHPSTQQPKQSPSPSRRLTAAQRKAPPSPPLTRRHSTHVSSNSAPRANRAPSPPPPPRSSATTPPAPIAIPNPPPPPPPPARRGNVASEATQSSPQNQKLSSTPPASSTPYPAPPPARRSSKRISTSSTPKKQLPSNLATSTTAPPPPPPPPGKRRSMNSAPAAVVEDEDTPTTPPATASNDILDDLSKLQAEIDALRGRYDAQAQTIGSGNAKSS